jgi:hypothetical protein
MSAITFKTTQVNSTNYRSILYLFGIAATAWVHVLMDYTVVREVAGLYQLADSANPYFVALHAWTLYVRLPLLVMSTCVLFLSPGLFLSLALGSGRGFGHWLLKSFALSLVVVSAVAGIVQWVIGNPLQGVPFAVVVFGCTVVSFIFLLMRLTQGSVLIWPLTERHAYVTILSTILVPLLILILIMPKFFWENFNGDGAHAFESARLLLFQPFPFWDSSAGHVAHWPGMTTMLFLYPASWFIRLFGEFEASVRLPILLYLAVLYGVMLALIEYDKTKPLGVSERWLIWFGLVVFVIVMAFNATYNPYFADIALPATQHTLLMVCFLGFILSFLLERSKLMLIFIGLTYISAPNGALLIGLWILSVTLIWRPRPWNKIALITTGLLACVVISFIVPYILAIIRQPLPGSEHGVYGLLKKFAFLQWADWRRVLFMIVPSGILPALALLAWRWQDKVARTLTVVTVVYFCFFYIQAHIALHYFVPAMLLPMVVFWRFEELEHSRRKRLANACFAVTSILAFTISLPMNATPHTSARFVGVSVQDRIGGYDNLEPAAFLRSSMLRHIFPYAWDPKVPFESYGGSPLQWYYYAHRTGEAECYVNYVLQASDNPPPIGMRLLAEEYGVKLYVGNDSLWASHRALRPPTPTGSKVYQIPRGILFRSVPLQNGPPIINMVDVAESLGIDLDPLLDRFKVER